MRFLLIAITILVILGTLLQSIAGLQPRTQNVVVASGPLAAGTTLTETDLTVQQVSENLLPVGHLTSIDDAVGEVLVAAIPPGLPVPQSMLLSSDFLESAPAGQVIVSVSVQADGTETLASPGSTISIYAPPDEFAESSDAILVAESATVVGVGASSNKGGFLAGESSPAHLLFVATPEHSAKAILSYASATPMRIVVQPRSD